jgi:hypothetical protein
MSETKPGYPTAVVPRRTVDDLYAEAFRQPPVPPPKEIPQTGGDHYKALGIYEPWKVMRAVLTPEEYRGYHKGTILAYAMRERAKGGDQDLQKMADHAAELANYLRELAALAKTLQ